MKEQRETAFALTLGQLMGYLSSPDIQTYLLEYQVHPIEIEGLQLMLKDMANKVFYADKFL